MRSHFKMNIGRLIKTKSGKTAYIKSVDWNKAVLWKNREISLNPKVVMEHLPMADLIIFIDNIKNKCWAITKEKVKQIWQLKKIGQEPQYYWSIDEMVMKDINTDQKAKNEDFYNNVFIPCLKDVPDVTNESTSQSLKQTSMAV